MRLCFTYVAHMYKYRIVAFNSGVEVDYLPHVTFFARAKWEQKVTEGK